MGKRIFLLFAAVLTAAGLLYTSCGSTDVTDADKKKIDAVADTWIDSLKSEDIKGLRSTYWPDAVHTNIQAGGSKEVKKGVDAILEGQQELFDSMDVFAQLEYPEPEKDFETDPDKPVYVFNVKEFNFSDTFQFEKRDGEWRIIDHILGPIE